LPYEFVDVERAAIDVERARDDGPGVVAGEAQFAGAGDLDIAALRCAEAVQTDGEVELGVVEWPERDLAPDGGAAGIAAERDVDAEDAVVDDAERALHVAVPNAHRLPDRAPIPQREFAAQRGAERGAAQRERPIHPATHIPER